MVEAGIVFQRLFSGITISQFGFVPFYYIAPLVIVDLIYAKTSITKWLLKKRLFFWMAVWSGILIVVLFGNFEGGDFVYFQF